MISIQVVSHGKLAEGMLDSASMIVGNIDNTCFNKLERGQDFDEFREQVLNTTRSLLEKNDDGILILVDIYGASPYNASLINSRDVESNQYKVIAGVNLAIFLEAIVMRNNMGLDELYQYLMNMTQPLLVGWEKEKGET